MLTDGPFMTSHGQVGRHRRLALTDDIREFQRIEGLPIENGAEPSQAQRPLRPEVDDEH